MANDLCSVVKRKRAVEFVSAAVIGAVKSDVIVVTENQHMKGIAQIVEFAVEIFQHNT